MWFEKIDKLEKQIVKINIESNEYYEKIKGEYYSATKEVQEAIIEKLFLLYSDGFNGLYSIYAVMDAVENYMKNNEDSTIFTAIDNVEEV